MAREESWQFGRRATLCSKQECTRSSRRETVSLSHSVRDSRPYPQWACRCNLMQTSPGGLYTGVYCTDCKCVSIRHKSAARKLQERRAMKKGLPWSGTTIMILPSIQQCGLQMSARTKSCGSKLRCFSTGSHRQHVARSKVERSVIANGVKDLSRQPA